VLNKRTIAIESMNNLGWCRGMRRPGIPFLTVNSCFADVCAAVSFLDGNAETPLDLSEAWSMLEYILDPADN
jgi:hypothetical protein